MFGANICCNQSPSIVSISSSNRRNPKAFSLRLSSSHLPLASKVVVRSKHFLLPPKSTPLCLPLSPFFFWMSIYLYSTNTITNLKHFLVSEVFLYRIIHPIGNAGIHHYAFPLMTHLQSEHWQKKDWKKIHHKRRKETPNCVNCKQKKQRKKRLSTHFSLEQHIKKNNNNNNREIKEFGVWVSIGLNVFIQRRCPKKKKIP